MFVYTGNNDNNGSSVMVTLAGVVYQTVLFSPNIRRNDGNTVQGE